MADDEKKDESQSDFMGLPPLRMFLVFADKVRKRAPKKDDQPQDDHAEETTVKRIIDRLSKKEEKKD